RRALPLHVRVRLKNLPQAPTCNGLREKDGRIVAAVLADHSELNSGRLGACDHASSRGERGSHRLLHQDVFPGLRAQLYGLQAKVRQSAYIDEVDLRMAA